jgi:hypothetical protein
MPQVGFESTIPVFERAKTFHALDLAATVIGSYMIITITIFSRRVSVCIIDNQPNTLFSN